MVSTFPGGVCYTQSAEVLAYLQITNAQPADVTLLDNIIIPRNCKYIDTLAGTTWGSIEVTEVLSIGRYALYGMYVVGAPVYLSYFPVIPAVPGIQSLLSFKVWNGNQYQEWIGNQLEVEARFGNYWVEPQDGQVFVMGWYWYMGAEIETTYAYGYGTTGTPYLDPYVQELAIKKSAMEFLESNRYTAVISQGIGGIEMTKQYDSLVVRVKELEGYVKGYRTIQSGILS